MIKVVLINFALLIFQVHAEERSKIYNSSSLEKVQENTKKNNEKEADRIKKLFEAKDLGLFEYEDYCTKESLEEIAIKSLAGIKSNCKKKYYLRLRFVCAGQDSLEIPFPKKNLNLIAIEKISGQTVLKLTGTPEDGYIQGAIQSKKDLEHPFQLTIKVEFKEFKKTISAEEARMPIVIPISECFKKT